MLLVCACLVAGCGGSSLQAKAREVVGDPHATVVRTETVNPLGGGRLTVLVLKPSGSTGLGCVDIGPYPGTVGTTSTGTGTTTTSSLVPGCPPWSYAVVGLNPTTHADGGVGGAISRFQLAAIAKAKAANPQFAMFPSVNQLTVRCRAPNPNMGAVGYKLPGICATVALPFGKPVRCVAFTMGWRQSARAKMNVAAWVVRLDRNGHIQSTREVAHVSPPWNGHQPQTCSEIN